jgi:ribosomal protein L7/L12
MVNLENVDKDRVWVDVAAGLKAVGYSRLAAIKGLRILGLPFAEAKAVVDVVETAVWDAKTKERTELAMLAACSVTRIQSV